MLILIAGPYRGGTNDNPDLIQKNLNNLEAMALPIYEKGHVPIIGEWIALPLMKSAGYKHIGDEIWNKMQYPVSHRLLAQCDAILRIPGISAGADADVALAQKLGMKIYTDINQIPNV